MASWATMLLSFGTILGCLALPWLAAKIGRRGALGLYFALMFVCISVGFGYVFYLGDNALPWFLVCLFFLGMGGLVGVLVQIALELLAAVLVAALL